MKEDLENKGFTPTDEASKLANAPPLDGGEGGLVDGKGAVIGGQGDQGTWSGSASRDVGYGGDVHGTQEGGFREPIITDRGS
ncbi:MAG TPA: hypothetical protein VF914_21085 [Chloroflexia bacterium]